MQATIATTLSIHVGTVHTYLIELHFTHTHRDICGFWGSFLSMDTAQSDSDMSILSLLWLLITRARDCDVHVHERVIASKRS